MAAAALVTDVQASIAVSPPAVRFRTSWRYRWGMVRAGTDAALLLVAASVSRRLRAHIAIGADPEGASRDLQLLDVIWLVPVWLLVLVLQGAYSMRRTQGAAEQQRVLLLATVVALGLAGTFIYLVDGALRRSVFVVTFAVGYLLLALARPLLDRMLTLLRRRGWGVQRAVLLGNDQHLDEALAAFRRAPRLGFVFLGTLGGRTSVADLPELGTADDVRATCLELDADTVVLTGGAAGSDDLRSVAWTLQGTGVEVILLPDLIDVASPRLRLVADAGIPRVLLSEPRFDRPSQVVKRAADLFGAVVLLVLTVPILALATVAILREDRGPVFFRQTRVGRDGREFECLKLRTMRIGADSMEPELRHGHDGAQWKLRGDPRVTRCGRWLRAWSVDELPQLLNVVRGDMSLVGPRPQQLYEVQTYSPEQARRLLVRPGMTGLWQVSGRSDLSLEESVRLDHYYVENWSLAIDVVILARTASAVLARRGAY